MRIYLTKIRWDILYLMSESGVSRPKPMTVDTAKNRLGLSQHNVTVALTSMMLHGILVRVGAEYRVTRLGAQLCRDMTMKTINEITFEVSGL